jgi:hypothetical protein
MVKYEFLDKFDNYMNKVFLIISIAINVWYFWRFKFRTDRMALIVIISNSALIIARIFLPIG